MKNVSDPVHTSTIPFKELENYTVFQILICLFLALLAISIYVNVRLIVIVARSFRYEKREVYYPMLLLMNILSLIDVIILLYGSLLPWFSNAESDYDVIVIPFIYALVTPTEIAAVDLILCVVRMIFHHHQNDYKWTPVIIFIALSPGLAFISYHAQMYTVVGKDFKSNRALFIAFLTDNVLKGCCSIVSFLGYCLIYSRSKSKTLQLDCIIRQAFPIAGFQTFTITIQTIMELPFTPKLDERERFLLDICFSAACSVAVPLCTIIGETKKRDMFYDTFCCCYCYCEPRAAAEPQPQPPVEGCSRAKRQKAEEQEALRVRREEQEERRRRRMRAPAVFSNLDESGGSRESGV